MRTFSFDNCPPLPQVLGVGLAVGLCVTVVLLWALLNIDKIQYYAKTNRVPWLEFVLEKRK